MFSNVLTFSKKSTVHLLGYTLNLRSKEVKLIITNVCQVLCKNLEIDVAQLKPSIYLKDPERIRKIEFQLSQPIKKEQSTLVQSSQNTLMADTELANILPGQTSSSPVSTLIISV